MAMAWRGLLRSVPLHRRTRIVSRACFVAQTRALHATCCQAANEKNAAAAPPRRPSGLQNHLHWQIHREIVEQKRALSDVFARLQQEVAAKEMPAKHLRHCIDYFFYQCAQQAEGTETDQQIAPLSSAFLADVAAFFERELFPATTDHIQLGTALNESTIASVVRLYVALQEVDAAWKLVDRLIACAGATRLHFRTFKPVLQAECQRGGVDHALKRWQQVQDLDMEWNETMEDALIDLVIACQTRRYETNMDLSSWIEQVRPLLRDLRVVTKNISVENATRLREVFERSGYTSSIVASDKAMVPMCPSCNTALHKEKVTEDEWERLRVAIEQTKRAKANTTALNVLAPFKKWLESKHAKRERPDQIHYVLDGPNIAYLNQNFSHGTFRFDVIDAVVQMLQTSGHLVSITIPYIYLGESSTLSLRTKKARDVRRAGGALWRSRTPEEEALIARWQQENLVWGCRLSGFSDDLCWMYASALLGDQVRVVTNDLGRDHIFVFLNPDQAPSINRSGASKRSASCISMDLLERWREASIVGVSMQFAIHGMRSSSPSAAPEASRPARPSIKSLSLTHPKKFSRVPQLDAHGQLHVPFARTQWLCLTPPPTH